MSTTTPISGKPFFTVGNENVKGVVRLEIDQDYGKTNTAVSSDLVPGVKQNDGATKEQITRLLRLNGLIFR